MEVGVIEAAARLGVHQTRVRQLLASGRLVGRRVGSVWLVDDRSLARRLETSGAAHGRPLSTRVAWSAAALLDGHETPWLTTSERSRLRARLGRADATDAPIHRWWMASRGSATRYRLADSDLAELCASQAVVAGGISAADSYGLGMGYSNEAEVYVDPSVAEQLVAEFFLLESVRGNLTLHVVTDATPWHRLTATTRHGLLVVPRLVVAVDLLDSEDARSRRAGAGLLEATVANGTHEDTHVVS